jgi:hypothetical protein
MTALAGAGLQSDGQEEEFVPAHIQASLRLAFKTYYDGLSKNVHRGRTVSPLPST